MTLRLILASASTSRRLMLESSGVPFCVAAPNIDEDAIKSLLSGGDMEPCEIAGELAQAKALSISAHMRDALVLGADQLLICEGKIFNKPLTEHDARDTLLALHGREHQLISAAVIARAGVMEWRCTERATLHMRRISAAFLDQYLTAEIPDILGLVGAYRIEGRGAQLFERVTGDYFCIRGLPLIPLLGALRDLGVIGA